MLHGQSTNSRYSHDANSGSAAPLEPESDMQGVRMGVNLVRYFISFFILFTLLFGGSLSSINSLWLVLGVSVLALGLLAYVIYRNARSSHFYHHLHDQEDMPHMHSHDGNDGSHVITFANHRGEVIRMDMRSLRIAMTNRDFNADDYEMLLSLDRDNAGRSTTAYPPAHSGQIQRLPEYTISSSQHPAMLTKECVICLEQYREGDAVRTLPCLHQFHKSCVDTWLSEQGRCPTCKMPIA